MQRIVAPQRLAGGRCMAQPQQLMRSRQPPSVAVRRAALSILARASSRTISSRTISGSSSTRRPPPPPQQLQDEAEEQLPAQRQQPRFDLRGLRKRVVAAVESVDPRLRGLILLNCMTFLMGSNWVVLKESNDAFDPIVFTSLRFTLAAAAFAPFLARGLACPSVRRSGLEIGLWTAAGYLAQSWALSLTPASRASLLSTFTVIAVPCLAGLSGQRVKPLVWACGIAALVGTTLLEQGGGEPPNAGDLLSILSALFFAMQLFRTEKQSRALPDGSALPFMAVTLSTVAAVSVTAAAAVHWQDAAAAAGSLAAVLGAAVHAVLPWTPPAGPEARPLYELLYTSFASTDLVLLIELLALQDVSSTEAALIYSLEPVSGALMAYAFLGERWGPLGWCGAGVILAASVATQLGGAMGDDEPPADGKGAEARG